MDAFVARGGGPLHGTVRVSGAKNSALKLVAAALLAPGQAVIRNVPDIADMRVMAQVLEHLGVAVRTEPGQYTLDVPDDIGDATPEHLVRMLRASIIVLGPLLARRGHARLAMPGGCNLGNRSIDMHLSGLQQMGAEIVYGADYVEAWAPRLRGADIELPFASVGATENLLMAAVTAEGTTRLSNVAREPEIADLAAYLSAMGARIEGAGSPEIVIHGVPALHAADHTVVPDRIEAGTFAVAAALTGGEIRVEEAVAGHLRLPLEKLRAIGAEVDEEERAFTVRGGGRLKGADVVTLPYPGFPTDLQPQFLVLLARAHGTSIVTENVFDGRFSILDELRRLGADVSMEGHHAMIRGPRALSGTTVRATDLRAGAALVLAGLVAGGETVVTDPYHVDRGYEDFAGKLRALGADVERHRPEGRPVEADLAAGVG
ncbi:MAG TPA: UDP-N-acetylglucosamine 1-carboxyvinyltransferase [Egibacteraceae bacterium]|nr:UDP-N-acetylglucosamine 1-carboxyvinyltransferase [Egibacteraceae bacterium]